MIVSSSIVPPGGLVLVTGVTGFIGSYIANGLLELGYRVRGTVRASEKAAWVTQALTKCNPSADFEAVIVSDQNAPGAWDAVLKDVDGIAHGAGDVSFGRKPNNSLFPTQLDLRYPQNILAWSDTKTKYWYKELDSIGIHFFVVLPRIRILK
jgi:nucleoside-diphosphate-sugar epimerase